MPLIPKDAIRIEGLKELQAALRSLDGESQKLLRVVMNDAAGLVVDDARRGVPTRTGRARASVKAQSGQRDARIIGGSKRVPYYPWLDFGGRTGRNKSVNRRYISDGRYIYPSYRQNRGRVLEAMRDGLARLVRNAGWET